MGFYINMKIKPSKLISEVALGAKKDSLKATQNSASKMEPLGERVQSCHDAYGKALINSKPKNNCSLIESLFEGSNIHITRTLESKDGTLRIQAGRPIKGFNNLYDSSVRICQKCDLDGNLKIYVKDDTLKTIDIYDEKGQILSHFSKEDVEALHYYKYNPQYIHGYLRNQNARCSGCFFEEMEKAIVGLEKIFNTESQIQKTTKPMTVYRGMHTSIDKIGKIGDTFTDKSFTSITTNLDVARRFANENPVLELEIPQNTKYLNMDNIFNIDYVHWREDELLLENNNTVEILDIDEVNNIIKARLLSKF